MKFEEQKMIDKPLHDLIEIIHLFKTISDEAGYGSMISDFEGNIIYMNESFAKMHGCTADEIVGKNHSIFYTVGQMKSLNILKEYLRQKGNYVAEEVWHKKRDGSVFPTLMNGTLISDSSGKPLFIAISVIDITERKRMEKELKQYSDHLEELVDEKTRELKSAERMVTIGETAGMVGHDLRNPLQAIVNTVYLANMKLESLPDEIAEKGEVKAYLDAVERQVVYMNKIVSDLQDYTRPIHPELTEISMHQLIQGTLLSMNVPETIEISVAVPKRMKLKVDPSLMRRVFINLIMNAVQAMSGGGILTIKAHKTDEAAFISVKDTGVGIHEQDLPKLFQPLFTTKAKGQGFGLPVCERIVKAHNGEIIVKSKVGKGSTFTVKIPLRRV